MKAATIALYGLPAATALVIGFSLFVLGAPQPYSGARVWGGPIEGAEQLGFRLEVIESDRGVQAPLTAGPVELEVTLASGERLAWSGELDPSGSVNVQIGKRVAPIVAPPRLTVRRDGQTIAEGRVWLSIADWLSRARRRGGYSEAPSKGELSLRVAPARGALAVPFAERLLVKVTRASDEPASGASLHVEPEGLDLIAPRAKDELYPVTADGLLELTLRPREHTPALGLVAEEDGKRASWYGVLPIVPGALWAKLEGQVLRIASPVEREYCYFTIHSERARITGGIVRLGPDASGGASALVALPKLPEVPLWAAVSSDPELASETTVGWPISGHAAGAPHTTLEVPERLLLDGLVFGSERQAARQLRAKLIAGGFTLLALMIASVIVIARVRGSARRLEAHLDASGTSAEERAQIRAKSSTFWVAVAVACITLGFAVIALVALYRLG